MGGNKKLLLESKLMEVKMDYDEGKAFELINEKLDMVLAKLYPSEAKDEKTKPINR